MCLIEDGSFCLVIFWFTVCLRNVVVTVAGFVCLTAFLKVGLNWLWDFYSAGLITGFELFEGYWCIDSLRGF